MIMNRSNRAVGIINSLELPSQSTARAAPGVMFFAARVDEASRRVVRLLCVAAVLPSSAAQLVSLATSFSSATLQHTAFNV